MYICSEPILCKLVRERMEGSLGNTTVMGDMESLDTRRGERERWGERIDEWLCDAAMRGDVESLKKIITIDGYILNKVLVGSFKGKNPLHVAILSLSKAATEFVQELLLKNPDLAEVFDMELGTALHVASAKGHLEIVKLLVKVSPEMCLTHDRDGNNPLHIAAMKGKAEVLKELVQSSLRRAQVKTDRGDTILHLCVKYDHFDCLQQLLRMIPDKKFANAADNDGNTILHLAVFEKKWEMVKYLVHYKALGKDSPLMYVNAVNKIGRTALDIFVALKSKVGNQTESEIEDLLHKAGARSVEDRFMEVEEPSWMTKRRSTIMIVCSLVATMAFQVVVNPPGGVWQDSSADHKVGKSILAYSHPYSYSNFMYVNTLGFLMSLSTIFVLILSLPEPRGAARTARGLISWSIIMALVYSYTFSVVGISPKGPEKQGMSVSIGVVTAAILWAGMMTLFLRNALTEWVIEKIYNSRDRPRSLPKANGENRSPV